MREGLPSTAASRKKDKMVPSLGRKSKQVVPHDQNGRAAVSAAKPEDQHLEPCQVGLDATKVPTELFDLHDPSVVFSLDTWYNVLDDAERESLSKFLPSIDREDPSELLEDVLENSDFHFGNPADRFWQMLTSGHCHPRVAALTSALAVLEKKQHGHTVRIHHNKMLATLSEMKRLWDERPEAGLEDKLRTWETFKNNGYQATQGPSEPLTGDRDVAKQARQVDDSPARPKAASKLALPQADQPATPRVAFSIRQLFHSIRMAMLKGRIGPRGADTEAVWTPAGEIARRVKEHPCDTRIFDVDIEVSELVLAGLKVLQTKAPPGTRLWKPFVHARKQGTEWLWCGLMPKSNDDLLHNASCDSWGVSEKGMAKLEERFVNLFPEGSICLPEGAEEPVDSGGKAAGGSESEDQPLAVILHGGSEAAKAGTNQVRSLLWISARQT